MHLSVQNDFNKISSLVSTGDLFPAWRGKAEQALLVMYVGQSLGLNWVYSLTNITVINGRPVVWGDAMMALCQRSTCMEYCHETFNEQIMTAVCEVKRVGRPAQTRQFSQKDAEKAGLWTRGPWRSYPQRMLQMRARGFALRDVFADVLQGIGLAEEVQDYEFEQEGPTGPSNEVKKKLSNKSVQLLQKGQFAKLEDVEESQEVQEDRDEVKDSVEPTLSEPVKNSVPSAFERKRDLVLTRLEDMGVTQSKILASLEKGSIEEIDASNLEHLINIGKGIKEGKGAINQAFL